MIPKSWIQAIVAFFTPGRMLTLFTVVNILNYVDRYIVPGAVADIKNFIQDDLGKSNVDTEIGVLQSAFIVGYVLSSITVGHLVHKFPPFKLMSIGLLVWCIAALLSGAAPRYWVLVVARALSGVGEAGFQCVVPPFIDDNAPQKTRTFWLAVFFAAIPVGSAIGFGWGASWGILNWRYAFYFEIPLMLPLIFFCWWFPFHRKSRKEAILTHRLPGTRNKSLAEGNEYVDDTFDAIQNRRADEVREHEEALDLKEVQYLDPHVSEGFWEEFKHVITQPLYLLAVLGYAGYTAVTAGFASFGPDFLHGMGTFDSSVTASLVFGAIISVTGFLGAPLGGWLIDYHQKILIEKSRRAVTENFDAPLLENVRVDLELPENGGMEYTKKGYDDNQVTISQEDEYIDEDELEENATSLKALDLKLVTAFPQIFVETLIGVILCAVSVWFAKIKPLFLSVLGLGCFSLFLSTSGVNLAIMASVPARHRPFALGLGTVLQHGLGDVPSPPAIGAIADLLSPEHCNDDHKDCTRSFKGLQLTLFVVTLWLFWPVLLWGIGACVSYSRRRRNIASGAYVQRHHQSM